MDKFADDLIEALKKSKTKKKHVNPQVKEHPLGMRPPEAHKQVIAGKKKFSPKCQKISSRIIDLVNSDYIVNKRRELINSDEKEITVNLMVEKILFTIDRGSFSYLKHGNDFERFSDALKKILESIETVKNAPYLTDAPEIKTTIIALKKYFELHKAKGQRGNFLSDEVALRIYMAWQWMGYSEALDYTEDGKSNPLTGLAVFADVVSECIENYLSDSKKKNKSKIEYTRLTGLRSALSEIKSKKLEYINLSFPHNK